MRGEPPAVGTFAAAAATGDALYGPRGLGSWARHGLGGGGAGGGAGGSGAGGGGAGVEEGVGSRTAHAAGPKGAAQLQRKLVVVLLGGSSHAELRCAHDALAEQRTHGGDGGDGGGGWQLYFGSTAVLTPLQYVRALSETPPPPPLATF